LPAVAESEIITIRNRRRRYRNGTFVVGYVAVVLLIVSTVLYFKLTSFLRTVGKVCELSEVTHDVAIAVVPFLLAATLALLASIWFRARIARLKARS
jgi:hypothetical protein